MKLHQRRKPRSRVRSVIDEVADPEKRRQWAETAAETAAHLATDMAKRSTELGSEVGGRLSEVAHAVVDEGHEMLDEHSRKSSRQQKPRTHRLRRRVRKALAFAGVGAAAAYFLDPRAGAERRAAARRGTSTSAQAVGDRLDRAAHLAHQTADATAPEPDLADTSGEWLGADGGVPRRG